MLAFDHERLEELNKGYISSYLHALNIIGIYDEDVWASITEFLLQ